MRARPYFMLVLLIDIIVYVIEIFLGIRFLLKLLGANAVPFVVWVYQTTQPLISPFSGIFPIPQIEGRYVLEFTTIFAMIIYAIIGYVVIALLSILFDALEPPENK